MISFYLKEILLIKKCFGKKRITLIRKMVCIYILSLFQIVNFFWIFILIYFSFISINNIAKKDFFFR
jgi:hypothetical protein